MDNRPASVLFSPSSPKSVTVIVRAYGGEPVRLTAISIGGGYALVTGADRRKAVGFPVSDVFEFEDELYGDLATAYASGDMGALADLWGRATPIRAIGGRLQ